jgi:hypothetical protein
MRNKLRLLIREQIEKLFEEWYDDNSFEMSDIESILGGSPEELAAFEDMKEDPSFTEPIKNPDYKERGKLAGALINKDSEENIKDVEDYENFKKKQKQMKDFSFNESTGIEEGSDGNYMTPQNIESMYKGIEEIKDKIDYNNVPDWVQDKISKMTENIRALRDFYNANSKES